MVVQSIKFIILISIQVPAINNRKFMVHANSQNSEWLILVDGRSCRFKILSHFHKMENLITWGRTPSNAFRFISLRSFYLINNVKLVFNQKTLFSMKNVIFDLKVWNIQIEHVKYCIFTVSTRLFRVVFVTFTNWWTFFDRIFTEFNKFHSTN